MDTFCVQNERLKRGWRGVGFVGWLDARLRRVCAFQSEQNECSGVFASPMAHFFKLV